MTKLFAVFAAGVLFATALSAHAQSETARDVRAAVEFPLPDSTEVLGTTPPPRPRALVAIADANEGETDCAVKGLGFAIGTTLRVHAWGLSPAVGFTQPLMYWEDSREREEVAGLNPAQRVARRIGATHVLRSSAHEQADGMHLRLELVDVASGARLGSSERVAPRSIDAALADALSEVLAPLQFAIADSEGARASEWRATPDAAFASLREALTTYCASGKDYAKQIERAWQAQRDSPVLAALYADELLNLHTAADAVDVLNTFPGQVEHHPVVSMVANLRRAAANPRQRDDAVLATLKRLLATYPQEPAAWDTLSGALGSVPAVDATTPTSCTGCQPVPNHADYAQGIAIALEDIARWPHNYRAWWDLAYTVDRYADAVRGGEAWSAMSEQAARRYPKLVALAGDAARTALESHSGQANLYLIRMDAEAAQGNDWYGEFSAGIEAAPHAAGLYDDALNYASDKWGGDARERARIYRLARDNNPGASWPAAQYRYYAPGWESLSAIYGRDVAIAAVLLLIGGAVWWLRRRNRSN